VAPVAPLLLSKVTPAQKVEPGILKLFAGRLAFSRTTLSGLKVSGLKVNPT